MLKINSDKFLIAMAKAQITTTELKERSGIGRNTISKIMNGKSYVRPQIVGKIAKTLNISVEELTTSDE